MPDEIRQYMHRGLVEQSQRRIYRQPALHWNCSQRRYRICLDLHCLAVKSLQQTAERTATQSKIHNPSSLKKYYIFSLKGTTPQKGNTHKQNTDLKPFRKIVVFFKSTILQMNSNINTHTTKYRSQALI